MQYEVILSRFVVACLGALELSLACSGRIEASRVGAVAGVGGSSTIAVGARAEHGTAQAERGTTRAQAVGDGCSASCKLETGFKCGGQPSVCTPTVCGDGKREGAERCDDGNTIPFDGCSSTCKKEGGFECSQKPSCEKINDACILRVPVIYRDLTINHPDVEPSCRGAGTPAGTAATRKLVNTTLTNGVPTAVTQATTGNEANGCITSLDTWYSDKGPSAIVRDIVLFDNGKGGYVNRYGALGEQWASQPELLNGRFCGNGDTMCLATPGIFSGCLFDPTVDTCFYPCPPSIGSVADTCAAQVASPAMKYDGTPLFFPLDDQQKNEPWIDATLPTQYGYHWEFEDQIVPQWAAPHVAFTKSHNFHFTTHGSTYRAANARGVDTPLTARAASL